MGAFEIKTFSMISPKDFDRLGLRLDDPSRNVPALANPLDEDAAVMRPTLLAGVLKTMALNQNWQVAEVAFFELEKTFKAGGPNDLKEDFSLCVGLTAVPRQAGWKKTDKEEPDFFIIKGWVEKIMRAARVETFEIAALPCTFLQPGNAATLMVNQQRLGYLGKLHPGLQASYDLKREIYVLEINLSLLFKYVNAAKKCRPLPKYPAVTRDIAMIVSAATTYQSIKTVILAEGADLVEEIELFDFYTGRPVPDGHYSLALRITYRDKNKTCLDAEINQRHARVLEKLKTALNVEIRM
jgi:phenylalanyl-tRNA synthetase beta chain